MGEMLRWSWEEVTDRHNNLLDSAALYKPRELLQIYLQIEEHIHSVKKYVHILTMRSFNFPIQLIYIFGLVLFKGKITISILTLFISYHTIRECSAS